MADHEASQSGGEIVVHSFSSSDDSFSEQATPSVAIEAVFTVLETLTLGLRKRGRNEKSPTARKKTTKSTSTPIISSKTKAPRATFTVAITYQFMQICAEIRNRSDGLMNPTNKKLWGPAWDKMVSMMIDRCPGQKWTEKQLKSKFDTEQKRYR